MTFEARRGNPPASVSEELQSVLGGLNEIIGD